jgi:acyl-CoA thioesterase FadM
MGQRVYRNNNGELGDAVAELDLRIAVVNQEGRPQRIPARLKDVLERLRDKKG